MLQPFIHDTLPGCKRRSARARDYLLLRRYLFFNFFLRLLRIKAAHNTLQNMERSSSNKREEIKTNTTVKETK